MWLLRDLGKATKIHHECPVTKGSADESKRAEGLETRCFISSSQSFHDTAGKTLTGLKIT